MFERSHFETVKKSSLVFIIFLFAFQLGVGAASASIKESTNSDYGATDQMAAEELTIQEKLELYTQQIRDSLSCQASIVIDARTGKVLFSQDPMKRMAPASLTKILTCILAIESGDLDRIVEVKHNIVMRSDAVKLNLKKGDKIKMRALIYAALVKSACDACEVIAEEVGGSKSGFIRMMNQKAREIGATGSNFKNSHGLPEKDHYTCAYDLALIARYCMQNSLFRRIVSTKRVTLSYSTLKTTTKVIKKKPRVVSEKTARVTKTVRLKSTNKLLFKDCGVNGIKTGYTREAGKCQATSHTDGKNQSIVIVLKDSNVIDDTLELISYASLRRAVEQ